MQLTNGAVEQKPDIVIVGLQPWYTEIGSNCKSIALELSKNHRVLYINAPLDRKTILNEKENVHIQRHMDINSGKGEDLVEIQPNLWNYYPRNILESINWVRPTALFSLLNRINNRRYAADIRKALDRLGFKDFILFNDNDIFRGFYLKELLKPSLYIYYSRDNLLGVDYWRKHGRTLEPLHIAKADIAVANSSWLANYLSTYNKNAYYIGQGCDINLFDPASSKVLPRDMAGIPSPIIGYVGAINDLRLDPHLIRMLALGKPDRHIVLVGPEDQAFAQSDLHQLPNVHFLGRKAPETLPAYVAAFDVCINPQKVNPVTIGNYPLKIDEYLAMGKPVVATRTEALEPFEDYIYAAGTASAYPALIERALEEDSVQRQHQRTAFARTHTWESSVACIHSAIQKTLSYRNAQAAAHKIKNPKKKPVLS
jgi:teichuronic acid biosynthesis glycosyltransferase TuaH